MSRYLTKVSQLLVVETGLSLDVSLGRMQNLYAVCICICCNKIKRYNLGVQQMILVNVL